MDQTGETVPLVRFSSMSDARTASGPTILRYECACSLQPTSLLQKTFTADAISCEPKDGRLRRSLMLRTPQGGRWHVSAVGGACAVGRPV